MYKNYPEKWGFEGDLRKGIGRKIKAVELVELQNGNGFDCGWLIEFENGVRTFITGRVTTGTYACPSKKAMDKSRIIQPTEFANVIVDEKRAKLNREKDIQRRKEEEYLKLKKELNK